MLVVGLTGGIASGKSTVSRMFEEAGVPVICTDELSRRVVEPGTPGLEEIRRVFGDGVIDNEGRLNRSAMANLVFRDPSSRRALEAIIHPRVMQEKDRLVERLGQEGHQLVLVDVPLLFESDWEGAFDLVIVVYVPREVQETRLIERDGMRPQEARARLDAQMPIDRKSARADRLIDNSGPREKTREQVDAIMKELTGLASSTDLAHN